MDWKKENRTAFGKRMRIARNRTGLTQQELADELNKHLQKDQQGYATEHFSQRKISQLETGDHTKYLSRNTLDVLAKLLKLSDADCNLALPETNENDNWISVASKHYLLTKASSQEIKQHLGEYHCVFKSTETKCDAFIRSKMILSAAKDGSCNVTLELPVIEQNYIKHYTGKFFINHHFDTCYIILCDNRWQEVCMLIAPWFKPTIRQNKFLTPLVLTTSAGENKRPTVHRMLISREILEGELFELAKTQLLLNTDSIQITATKLAELKNVIEAELQSNPDSEYYRLAKKFCTIIEEEGTRETVIRIEEARLFDIEANCKSQILRSKATALVRQYSEGVYHNKIGKSGPKLINSLMHSDDE